MSELNWIDKDLGPVDAYALAVAGGYTGTKAQWIQEIANASTNAQTAATKASDAEAYAAGTRGGIDVDSDDPAYHNNAEYYSDQAKAQKEAAQAAAQTAAAAYGTDLLADDFSTESTYAVGDYVIYSGALYRCTTAVTTAGAWNNSSWTQVAVGGEFSSVKSAINSIRNLEYTVIDLGNISGTGTVSKTGLDIPAGTYLLCIDSISSTDTDAAKCRIIMSGTSGSSLDRNLDRTAIEEEVILTKHVNKIQCYASIDNGKSTGDTFAFTGIALKYKDNIVKKLDSIDDNIQAEVDYYGNTLENIPIAKTVIELSETSQGKYTTSGVYSTTGNWRSSHTNLISCKPGDKFLYKGLNDSSYYSVNPAALFYDKDENFVSCIAGIYNNTGADVITIPENVYCVIFQFAKNLTTGDVPEWSVTAIDPIAVEDVGREVDLIRNKLSGKGFTVIDAEINLFVKETAVYGDLDISTGEYTFNTTLYMVSDYIEIEPFELYEVTSNKICIYNGNKEFIGGSVTNTRFCYTDDNDAKFARMRIGKSDINSAYFAKANLYQIEASKSISNDFVKTVKNGGLIDYANEDQKRFEKTENLFCISKSQWSYMTDLNAQTGYPLSTTNHSNGVLTIMFIPVQDEDVLISNMGVVRYCLYNSDKEFIASYNAQKRNGSNAYSLIVPEESNASYMSIGLNFSDDGTHGTDTDLPNGWIRSEEEINKIVIYKKNNEKYYPMDADEHINPANYVVRGEFVSNNFDSVPNENTELFRMIRCEAIRAVNHTKHIYRIGNLNQYIHRNQHNWPHIKNMLAYYGIDICGFEEAQYGRSNDYSKKMSIGDYMKGWQFKYSPTFYPTGETESPYSNRDMVSVFPVVESEELYFPNVGQSSYNNRSALRTKIKLPRYLDCTGGDQYLGFYVIHPTVDAGFEKQKSEIGVCLTAMETDGCAFHIIATDSNAFDIDSTTHMPKIWDWMRGLGFKIANTGISKTVTEASPDHDGSIDQIFVSSNINIVNFNVINSYEWAYTEDSNAGYVPLSDHDFIYADIEFNYEDVVTKMRPMTEVALIQNLTNATSDTNDNYHIGVTYNAQNKAVLDNAITINLSAREGYTLSTVTVYVGGANKTTTYYSNGVVSIAAGTQVDGDIVITATATETT